MMSFFLLFIACFSFCVTWFIRKYALAGKLLDVPNERSSHSTPTPRGGGLAIVLGFLLSLPFLLMSGLLSIEEFLSFSIAGVIVATVGFIDDHGHVDARWRLLAHFSAAASGLYFLGGFPSISILGFDFHLGWFGHFFAIVYLVWMLNLYNFMDGIDGIAGIEAVTVCIGGVLLFVSGDFGFFEEQLAVLSLLMAALGFLFWNFPPAKIFMGDAGSGFVGLMLGLLSIAAAHINALLFWGWLILLGVFIVDATITLSRRAFAGCVVYEAHRSHAYQYLSRKWAAHKPVSIAVGIINITWLFPVALLVVHSVLDGFLGLIIAYFPIIILAVWLKAGRADSQEV